MKEDNAWLDRVTGIVGTGREKAKYFQKLERSTAGQSHTIQRLQVLKSNCFSEINSPFA